MRLNINERKNNVSESVNTEVVKPLTNLRASRIYANALYLCTQKILLTTMIGFCTMGCGHFTSASGVVSQGTFSQTLSHNGEEREFIAYVPSSYNGSEELPLLLNFHGFGGTANEFMNWTDMRSLAEAENFILVYPQGSLLDGSPHWNSSLPSADNKSSADDFGFVDALIEELSTTYRINPDRIYTSGFSNGAFFSYALACYRSDLIAAVASVSGTMTDDVISDCNPIHPTSVISIHGSSDYVIPYEGAPGYSSVEEIMNYWIGFNGTSTEVIRDQDSNIEKILYGHGEGNTSVVHYRINGGEHVWFEMNYEGQGTGELIWDFVSSYDINGFIGDNE